MSLDNQSMRLCVYPKDIMLLTGQSDRNSRDLYARIKNCYKKEKHQPVTIKELCAFLALPEDEVRKRLL